jgi:serine/threonine protein kinase/GAF domain-containing protein
VSERPDHPEAIHVLQRVAAEMNATLDLDEIYEIALGSFDELFEYHHAVILLVEPDGEMLRVVASRGYENQAIGGRVPIGTGTVGIVAARRRILQLSNLGQQRAYASAQRRQMMKAGRGEEIGASVPVPGLPNAESQIAIPLLVRDTLVGVFSIESPLPQAFDEHDRDLVTIVANQVASAIRNAQLYDERRRAADLLQAANATLEARVAERTAALERELRVAEDLLNHARSRVDGPLIGDSDAVRTLRDAVAREAASSEPLLLTGPPGVGKEAVARALHDGSGRTGAFIFVSCPEFRTQNRSTSRGPGSSTPTTDGSLSGKIELASGGTLFLDAVFELPPEHRRKLEGILDRQREHSPTAEGASRTRVIASTTRDSAFEESLARLFVRAIAVPALHERREDIPTLVDHFVRRHARQLGKLVEGVSPESMRRLETYAWPGNIRELQAVLERAILVSAGSPMLEIDEELLDNKLAVGSYRLISLLGSGGMGEVWLARHRLLARPAAVKLIRQEQAGADREQLVRRFLREAQVTAGLQSPHTVQLYDFGVNDRGDFYYVMELLQGLDLQEIVNRFGPQPAERVIMLLRQTCRSLAEAHDHGLVHRDIKPANLFVARLGSEYDFLKVLDFGIVKEKPVKDLTMQTAHDIVQGTPAFMAPEVVLGEEKIDGRTDLYSLACAGYWALTGQPVFEASSAMQMLMHHAQTPPSPPSSVSELPIPKTLEAVLMRCLEKDPTKRPASALELESLLATVRCEAPWNGGTAQTWWETHAPEIVGPQRPHRVPSAS